MFGHERLGEAEVRDEVVHGPLPAGEDVEDLAPRGSATALNASVVVAARAMAPSLYAYIGMCQPIGEPGSLGFMVDLKLELVNVPVSDVDRAKAFYADRAGFHHDHTVSDELRFVQLTPPGSAC